MVRARNSDSGVDESSTIAKTMAMRSRSARTVRVISRAFSVIKTVCGASSATTRAALSSGVRSGA